jgi:hypothetical protein
VALTINLPMPPAADDSALEDFKVLLVSWIGLPANTTALYRRTAGGDGSSCAFTFLVPNAVAIQALAGADIAQPAPAGGAFARALAPGDAAAVTALDTLVAAKLSDGSLALAVAQSGLATSLGYDSPESLVNAIAVQPAGVAVPAPSDGVSTPLGLTQMQRDGIIGGVVGVSDGREALPVLCPGQLLTYTLLSTAPHITPPPHTYSHSALRATGVLFSRHDPGGLLLPQTPGSAVQVSRG